MPASTHFATLDTSLLSSVFEALVVSKHTVKDDTIVEKFVSWLIQEIHDKDDVVSLLSLPAVVAFVENVTILPTDGSSSVCMEDRVIIALRLIAHCASINWSYIQENDAVTRLWDYAQQETLWESGSVRHTWLEGVRTIVGCHEGLVWIAGNASYVDSIVKLCRDTSMFVCRTSQNLVAYLIRISSKRGINVSAPTTCIDKLHMTLYDYVDTCLGCEEYCETGLLMIGLNILETMSNEQHKTLSKDEANNVMLKLKVVKRISDILAEKGTLHRMLHNKASTVLTLVCEYDLVTSEDSQCLLGLPGELLKLGHVKRCIDIAAWLINRDAGINDMGSNGDTQESCTDLAVYVTLPLYVALNKTPASHTNAENSVMKKGSAILRYSINTMIKISDKMPNMHDALPLMVELLKVLLHGGVRCDWFVKDNKRVLFDVLSACNSLLDSPSTLQISEDVYSSLMTLALQISKDNQTQHSTVEQAYQCIVSCICHTHINIYADLGDTLNRSLCHPQWEVRDTAVQTIQQLIQKGLTGLLQSEKQIVSCWLRREGLHVQAWKSMLDGESYVRAAAINTLNTISMDSLLWTDFIKQTPVSDVVGAVAAVVAEDSEAFARRAAVDVLCEWAVRQEFTENRASIHTALYTAMQDLDWQVKLRLLQFWKQRICAALGEEAPRAAVPAYAAVLMPVQQADSSKTIPAKLDDISQFGGFSAIHDALSDHDMAVKHLACAITQSLCCSLKTMSLYETVLEDKSDFCEPPAKQSRMETYSSDEVPKVTAHTRSIKPLLTPGEFLRNVADLDLDVLLEQSSQSTDEYTREIKSLLEDILTCLLPNQEDRLDVDCY